MKEVVCTTCGYRGPKPTYGCLRVGIVVILGFALIVPGILYALYVESQAKQCPKCQAKTLIPADSPRAQGL